MKRTKMIRVSLAMLMPLLLLAASSAAFAQDLPPGPKSIHRSSLPGQSIQGEFEMINLILDFAPGAATPLHTHGGPGIVTVLDGELVFSAEGKPDQLARPGDVYLDLPGTHHTASNKSANSARVSYFVLLPKGAALTTVAGEAQGGELPAGPKTVYRSTLPGQTIQGELEMINLILEFAPGAATPAHTHGGPGIVTVLDGEIAFGVEGQADKIAQAGGVYLDLPGTHHTAANKTTNPARVSYAVVLPKGAALTAPQSGPQAPAQQPPTASQASQVQQPAVLNAEQAGMPRTGVPSVPALFILALVLVVVGTALVGAGRLPAAVQGER